MIMKLKACLVLSVLLAVPSSFAQTTVFTYQGRLNSNGNPVTGSYDLTFTLFNASSSGAALSGPVTNAAVGVSNGLFNVTLDFGNSFSSGERWLEIGVRTNGAGSFDILSPRQQITSTPYAVQALSANTAVTATTATTAATAGSVAATNVSGTLPLSALPAAVITNGASGLNVGGNFTGTFSGNGNGLTNLNAAKLTGTVADSNLSANVVTNRQANVVLSGGLFGSFNGSFSGDGGLLTNLNAQYVGGVASSQFVELVTNLAGAPLVYTQAGTYTFAVPAGPTVVRMTAKLWGGGGAGGAGGRAQPGGGGAFVRVDRMVAPGEQFVVVVGAGGIMPVSIPGFGGGAGQNNASGGKGIQNIDPGLGSGGGGGQGSSLFKVRNAQPNPFYQTMAVAGGGGGGAKGPGHGGEAQPRFPNSDPTGLKSYSINATTIGELSLSSMHGNGDDAVTLSGGGGGGYGGGDAAGGAPLSEDPFFTGATGGGSLGDSAIAGRDAYNSGSLAYYLPGNATDPDYVQYGQSALLGGSSGQGQKGLVVIRFDSVSTRLRGDGAVITNVNASTLSGLDVTNFVQKDNTGSVAVASINVAGTANAGSANVGTINVSGSANAASANFGSINVTGTATAGSINATGTVAAASINSTGMVQAATAKFGTVDVDGLAKAASANVGSISVTGTATFASINVAGGLNVAGTISGNGSGLTSISDGSLSSNIPRLSSTNIFSGKLSIKSVNPIAHLEVAAGADNDGANDEKAIALAYRTGGYRHWIRSRHNIAGPGNAIDFYLNTSATPGGSAAPGTGNVHTMTLENGRVGVGIVNPSEALDVAGNIKSSGNISTPRWKVTKVLPYLRASLPRSGTFTSSGGTLIISASASAYGSFTFESELNVEVQLDGTTVGTLSVLASESFSHKALISDNIILTNVAAGSHIIALFPDATTMTDSKDVSQVTVQELPY